MDTENCHVCNADTPYPSVSHESVPSLIDNLTYALYGLVTKTVLSGRVQWTIPCDPNSNASIWGYTRNAGEGLMCYFLRVFQSANPAIIPSGTAGQVLQSAGGSSFAWSSSVTPTATTSVLGGFKLASSGSDVSISTASILALSTTGVSAGTFGNQTQIPVITIDAKGRLTGASVQSIAITSAQINGISASQVGSGITSAQISGLSAAQVGTGLTSAQITGLSAAQIGAGITSAQVSSIASAALPASGASGGTYGSNSSIPQITVDALGRITSVTNVGISGASGGTVTSVGVASTTLAVTSSPITSLGQIGVNLQTSGVAAGTYGSSGTHPTITINANGIVTGATNQIISIGASQVLAGLTSAQITGLSAVQIGAGLTSAQINGLSAAQVGTGITSAQINGLSAAQVGTGLTSAQITGISVTQVGSLGANVSTFLQTPTSANLISAVTDETGTGTIVFSTSPTIATPTINGYTEGVVPLTITGGTAVLSITAGTVITSTLLSGVSTVFTMPTPVAGKSFSLYLKQAQVGSPANATFTNVKWPSGLAPTITTTNSAVDIFSFVSDGTNWYGSFLQNFV